MSKQRPLRLWLALRSDVCGDESGHNLHQRRPVGADEIGLGNGGILVAFVSYTRVGSGLLCALCVFSAAFAVKSLDRKDHKGLAQIEPTTREFVACTRALCNLFFMYESSQQGWKLS